MKKQTIYLIISCALALLSSCELLVETTTDDAVGRLVYKIDQPIKEIFIREDMDLELVESNDNEFIIDGPQKILDKFSVRNDTGNVTLDFNKMGSWKYDKPKVQLRMPSLVKLNLYAFNNVFAADTLHSDTINIYNDGTGDVHLSVNCHHFLAEGTLLGIFYIDGKTDSLTINNQYSSSFRGANLRAQNVKITTESSNQQVVYPINSMTCNVWQTGNVYYVNKPDELIVNYFNHKSGRVIYDPNRE